MSHPGVVVRMRGDCVHKAKAGSWEKNKVNALHIVGALLVLAIIGKD